VGTLLPIFAKEDPYYKGKEDEWENWENAYLPEDEEELRKMNTPRVPLLLDFPHITRRVAAHRSRFMVFGTEPEPSWLFAELEKADSLKLITIEPGSIFRIRIELRESLAESVIFPDLDGLGREMNQLWEERK
jgi:hypothetical protein